MAVKQRFYRPDRLPNPLAAEDPLAPLDPNRIEDLRDMHINHTPWMGGHETWWEKMRKWTRRIVVRIAVRVGFLEPTDEQRLRVIYLLNQNCDWMKNLYPMDHPVKLLVSQLKRRARTSSRKRRTRTSTRKHR